MRRITILCAWLLCGMGACVSAQTVGKVTDFAGSSSAPSDGSWAEGTKFFYVRTLSEGGLKFYLCANYSESGSTYSFLTQTAPTGTSDDSYRWALVGDAENGYKFYNKAEGTSKVLDFAESFTMAEAASASSSSSFDLYTSLDEGKYVFLVHGSEHNAMNNSAQNGTLTLWDSAGALYGWNHTADNPSEKGDYGSNFEIAEAGEFSYTLEVKGGPTDASVTVDGTACTLGGSVTYAASSWRALFPGEVVPGVYDFYTSSVEIGSDKVKVTYTLDTEAFAAYKESLEKTLGYVGGYDPAAVTAEGITVCETPAALTAYLSGKSTVSIEEGKYYRLVSAAAASVARAEDAMIYAKLDDTAYKTYWEAGTKADVHAIWQFESASTATGSYPGYKIKNVNTGLYFGATTGGSAATSLVESSSAIVYRTGFYSGGVAQAYFTRQTNATVGFTGNGNEVTFIFAEASTKGGSVCGWEGGGANGNSAWYVVPATELEVTLNSANNADYYATVYLPFGAATPADGSVQVFRATADEASMKLNAVDGGVPARTGVILKGTSSSCVLTLSDDVSSLAEDEANDLSGTCTVQSGITASEYYILGALDGTVGFYHPNQTSLKANRAYMPASAVPTAAAATPNSLGFVFDDDVTGIGEVLPSVGESAPAVYYDLSGRRVLRPGKGIYVKDGRKVYVR